jgi:hypothetical protein
LDQERKSLAGIVPRPPADRSRPRLNPEPTLSLTLGAVRQGIKLQSKDVLWGTQLLRFRRTVLIGGLEASVLPRLRAAPSGYPLPVCVFEGIGNRWREFPSWNADVRTLKKTSEFEGIVLIIYTGLNMGSANLGVQKRACLDGLVEKPCYMG